MFPKGLVVITGASSGIGAIYADRAAAAGHDLLLVARRGDRLAELSDQLSRHYQVKADPWIADLADHKDLIALEQRLADQPVAALVNNAGAGGIGATSRSSGDAQEATIRLNVVALVRLSLAALTGFRAAGQGALVNIGSIAALTPSGIAASYCGSKAFVLNFTRSLQLEYAGSGIRIQVVLPGPVRTEFFTAQGLDDSVFPASSYISAAQLVDAAMAGLAAGEAVTTPTLLTPDLWDNAETARLAVLTEARGGIVGARYLTP